MERVTVFRSYRDSARVLAKGSPEIALEYIMAILDFGLDEIEPEFASDAAEAAFILTRPTLKNSRAKAEAGAVGGRNGSRQGGGGQDKEEQITPKPCEDAQPTNVQRANYDEVVRLYHEICASYPRVKKLTDARKKAISARLKEYSMEEISECFRQAESSAFLKGANDRNWHADFDWIMKSASMAKIIEGKYGDKKNAQQKTIEFSVAESVRSQRQTAAFLEELRCGK